MDKVKSMYITQDPAY